MLIEKGKFYRARNGEKVGPMVPSGDVTWPWGDAYNWVDSHHWTAEGRFYHGGGIHDRDIVDEWQGGPVITETVKRIVPGVYGRLYIAKQGGDDPRVLVNLADQAGRYNGVAHGWSLEELRAAIATLADVADALEPGK